jgi:hypothetical protein
MKLNGGLFITVLSICTTIYCHPLKEDIPSYTDFKDSLITGSIESQSAPDPNIHNLAARDSSGNPIKIQKDNSNNDPEENSTDLTVPSSEALFEESTDRLVDTTPSVSKLSDFTSVPDYSVKNSYYVPTMEEYLLKNPHLSSNDVNVQVSITGNKGMHFENDNPWVGIAQIQDNKYRLKETLEKTTARSFTKAYLGPIANQQSPKVVIKVNDEISRINISKVPPINLKDSRTEDSVEDYGELIFTRKTMN